MRKMSAVIELRVPEALRERIDKEAARLALRPVDVTRHALAVGLRAIGDPEDLRELADPRQMAAPAGE